MTYSWSFDSLPLTSSLTSGDIVNSDTLNLFNTNHDWAIGEFELLDAIDDWALGNLGDFDLLDLIDFWAVGCYYWDAGAEKYKASTPDASGTCQ